MARQRGSPQTAGISPIGAPGPLVGLGRMLRRFGARIAKARHSMRPSRRVVLMGLVFVAALVALAALAIISSDALAWRAPVVRAKLLGEIPEFQFAHFVIWLSAKR